MAIRSNVLYGNGANLNIGSKHRPGIYSENNVIEDNILSDSVLSGLDAGGFVGDTFEVLGNFPPSGPGIPEFNNHVVDNCIENTVHPTELFEGYGFTQAQNILNQEPQFAFADPDAGDFSIPATSPCFQKGPSPWGRTPTMNV